MINCINPIIANPMNPTTIFSFIPLKKSLYPLPTLSTAWLRINASIDVNPIPAKPKSGIIIKNVVKL